MFAYRWTSIIKEDLVEDHMEEFLELHKALSFRVDYAKWRVYTPSIGPNVLVVELNVESEEEFHRFFAEFNATPEAEAFWEKINTLTERLVSSERWEVWESG